MKALKRLAFLLVVLCFAFAIARRFARLPSLDGRTTSTALFNTDDTTLGKSIAPLVQANSGFSGIYPLIDSRDAFAARVHLAQMAERTLDIQYYLWEKDLTGTLLFEAIRAAADRGVRVRLLLDDNNTYGLDPILAALDSHPNIEVRLFNPFVIRKPRIGYLTHFARANRRMHNKSFTADNQLTIVGGRNISDEYFGTAEGLLFVDLDVIAAGPVVTDVSKDFDRYWACGSSYPADRIVAPVAPELREEISAAAEQVTREPAAVQFMQAINGSPLVRQLLEHGVEFEWAPARMISDDPAKGLGLAPPEQLFGEQLREVIGEPTKDVELVAAYYIPAMAGVNSFVKLAHRGVRLAVLTNSLSAADGPWAFSGYAKRRQALLKAGVTLFEMRRLSPDRKSEATGPLGSSGSSLHAKTFSTDGARFFVGSFNFDPRSRKLNTELGFVIDSPALAQKITNAFETTIPANSYQVRLTDKGGLYWTARDRDKVVRYEQEPGTGFWLRAGVWSLSLLPIDWLL